jgi:hypothetical protein
MQDPWCMMANDRVGNCVYAAAGHLIQVHTSLTKDSAVTLTDQQILDAYSRDTGYTPSDPSTDRGAYMLDALKAWRKLGIGGRKIIGFAEVDPRNAAQCRAASFLCGGLYCGFSLPLTAQDQNVWDVRTITGAGKPGSWGGHCVYTHLISGDSNACITWGYSQLFTRRFAEVYCDECYAVISEDFFNREGKTVFNFDLARLLRDIEAVTA